MTAEELRKNVENFKVLNNNIDNALKEFEVSIYSSNMEWVTVCWMSKSLVPAPVFFSEFWPYIDRIVLKFPNSQGCGKYLFVPVCLFVPTTELKRKFWGKKKSGS